MASKTSFALPQLLLIALSLLNLVSGGRVLQQTMPFKYHNGPLLTGRVSLNLIWYGQFTQSQKSIISDFVTSLSSSPKSQPQQPSVANWVNSIQKYYTLIKSKPNVQFYLGTQTLDQKYSLGKSLKLQQIQQIAAKAAAGSNQLGTAVNVVLTSSDVAVEGFCSSRCGTHGSLPAAKNYGNQKFTYIWVGNSETQCPGQCAWPFHQPIYGPQGPPLVAPNNDVGIDGMVINLATLLAGTATNPFGNGYYQGPATAPLEAATACPGIFGKGAYPGYAGNLLVDSATKASYNANGVNKRKFLLPALFDPASNACSTLV
ncbi:OLC1v1017370C1 [Oldenlandia corymbosa var. corymbosa]|uniref:OLC1v1017370C1 n=1 Tax=Oldenlandia corymbosa var. corymbosa TaxID=529605 RepID=A0AAV1E9B8_OLDCO|nr:OLC1v1017370C1 [Oldenlandia corymbosa var. corymbosa]